MKKRIITKIGDVFCVKFDNGTKRYFQYMANDMTQLNSSVIVAFRKTYKIDESPLLKTIITDEADFYAHVVLRWGIEMELWEKIGNAEVVTVDNILFRDSDDYGNPNIKVSNNWKVWKIGEPFKYVGKLVGKNRMADIGVVISPLNIVDRMKTGKYHFVYPGFE